MSTMAWVCAGLVYKPPSIYVCHRHMYQQYKVDMRVWQGKIYMRMEDDGAIEKGNDSRGVGGYKSIQNDCLYFAIVLSLCMLYLRFYVHMHFFVTMSKNMLLTQRIQPVIKRQNVFNLRAHTNIASSVLHRGYCPLNDNIRVHIFTCVQLRIQWAII